MKKTHLILILFIGIGIITSFKYAEQDKTAQHARLALSGSVIQISYSDGEFSEISIKKDRSDLDDMGPILRKISEMESRGWRVIASEGGLQHMRVHMRLEK